MIPQLTYPRRCIGREGGQACSVLVRESRPVSISDLLQGTYRDLRILPTGWFNVPPGRRSCSQPGQAYKVPCWHSLYGMQALARI